MSQGIWIFAQQKAGKLANVTYELLAAAKTLGSEKGGNHCRAVRSRYG